ncbi:MAG: hypothetical protein F6J97_12015 [Leptolyngbya sp. SIO4C1]|nr:hypothetical protein [Leptolyngbya sp. SIO4C1]
MKRFLLLLTLPILLSLGLLPAVASAQQVGFGDSRADLNEDGSVTLHELIRYNRNQRNKK